jgi:ATP-dependent Clp protease ATP-binding subunit ClpA
MGDYTPEAERVLQSSNSVARLYDAPFVTTSHLLLALLDTNCRARQRIEETSSSHLIRRCAFADIRKIKPSVGTTLTNSPRFDRVCALAREEANSFSLTGLDSDHILLGILRERFSRAAYRLEQQGITYRPMRESVAQEYVLR